jgi:hypothetical protein
MLSLRERLRGWVLNPVPLTRGARECLEIGKANLASHLRRAIGADVEAFTSPEERVLETIPSPVRGAVSKRKEGPRKGSGIDGYLIMEGIL